MLRLTLPTLLNGDMLEEQLAANGLPTPVASVGDMLELADLDETRRSAAQAVIDAHPATVQQAQTTAATHTANEQTIRQRASDALASNSTFLALTSPTNAQVVTQVKALTRQNNALIRLALQAFDGTD